MLGPKLLRLSSFRACPIISLVTSCDTMLYHHFSRVCLESYVQELKASPVLSGA